MNVRRSVGPLAILLSLRVAGCGQSDELAPPGIDTWILSEEPVLELGRSEASPLDRVRGALRLSDGTIVVGNGGTRELIYFDSAGSVTDRVGGAGGGPQELNSLGLIARLGGDTVVAFGGNYGQYVLAHRNAGIVQRSPVLSALMREAQGPCRLGEVPETFDDDGSAIWLLQEVPGIPGCQAGSGEGWRGTAHIVRVDWRLMSVTPLATLAGTEYSDGSPRALGREPLVAAGHGLVFLADSGADSIEVLSAEGIFQRRIPMPFAAKPLPRGLRRRGEIGISSPAGDARIEIEYDYGKHYPRISRLLLDRDGNLWVSGYPEVREPLVSRQLRELPGTRVDARRVWRIVEPTGSILAQVTTPADFYVTDIGLDWVLGVSIGEYDEHIVTLYRFGRPAVE